MEDILVKLLTRQDIVQEAMKGWMQQQVRKITIISVLKMKEVEMQVQIIQVLIRNTIVKQEVLVYQVKFCLSLQTTKLQGPP